MGTVSKNVNGANMFRVSSGSTITSPAERTRLQERPTAKHAAGKRCYRRGNRLGKMLVCHEETRKMSIPINHNCSILCLDVHILYAFDPCVTT